VSFSPIASSPVSFIYAEKSKCHDPLFGKSIIEKMAKDRKLSLNTIEKTFVEMPMPIT
jgi:hypothetical protein